MVDVDDDTVAVYAPPLAPTTPLDVDNTIPVAQPALSYRAAVLPAATAVAGGSAQHAPSNVVVEAQGSGSVAAGSKRKTPDDDDDFQECMTRISPKYRRSVIDVMKYLVSITAFPPHPAI